MQKCLALLLALASGFPAMAQDWPVKLLPVGCKITFENSPDGSREELEITGHLPFPQIRIKSDVGARMAALLGEISGKTYNGTPSPSLFCGDACGAGGRFARAQRRLFPLKVGRKIAFQGLQYTEIEVLRQRRSAYISGTDEFLIQTSIIPFGGALMPAYRIWWNPELGFYTEREVLRLSNHQRMSGLTCGEGTS